MKSMEIGFTSKELDVIECMKEGLSNLGIAERLSMSENTVKTHIYRIYDKLGITEKDPKTNSRVTAINRVAQRSAEMTVTHIIVEGIYGDGLKFRKVTPVELKFFPDNALYVDFKLHCTVENSENGKKDNGYGASNTIVKCM